MKLHYTIFFIIFICSSAFGQKIKSIEVEGNQRIEKSTVIAYMAINKGDEYSQYYVAKSIKSLFETGLFADVKIKQNKSKLTVTVVENPIINKIAFEGNKEVDDEDLEKEIKLKSRLVYNRTKVQQDAKRVLDIYRREGYFSAKVTPKIIKLKENRVNLVFEMTEGDISTIKDMFFIGNKAFTDNELAGEIRTEKATWYNILSSNDTYDPDRLLFDSELLKKHYLNNGYADFEMLSSVGEYSPKINGFLVTFSLNEGDKYRFGKIDIKSEIDDIEKIDLSETILTEEGKIFNNELVEKTIDKLINELGSLGYAFVDIKPIMDKKDGIVDIKYQISEGMRVYIERINITGNVRTLDTVIRREVRFAEGDPYSTAKLKRTEQRIKNLGYFKKVDVKRTRGSTPDKIVISIDVVEQSTGSLNFAAGYSTSDGPLGSISVEESNLLGKGQKLKAKISIASEQQQIDLGFTEPYFMGRDIAVGADIFLVQRDLQDESSYDLKRQGFKLRGTYSLTEYLRHGIYYMLKEEEITNINSAASLYIQQQEGKNLTSLIGHNLVYDKRDNRFRPSEGYYLKLNNELAGLGGDISFLKTEVKAAYYYSIFDKWVLQFAGTGGYIFGLGGDDVPINERFFKGGRSLRGFESGGIGPRDASSDDALGGNAYYTGTVELEFPIAWAEELGFKGSIFTDFGTLWGIDDADGVVLLDKDSIRSSVGAGLSWTSPMGPIRIDYARPITKEDFDETEYFRLSFGARF